MATFNGQAIADGLLYIHELITNLRVELTGKGVSVGNVRFSEYANLIRGHYIAPPEPPPEPIPEPPALVDNLAYEEIRAGDDISFVLTQESTLNPYRSGKYAKGFILVWNPENDGDLAEVRLISETDAYLQLVDSNGQIALEDDDGAGNRNSLLSFNPANYVAPLKIVATTYNDSATNSFQITVKAPNAVALPDPMPELLE